MIQGDPGASFSMLLDSRLIQILFSPYLVGLYQPTVIPYLFGLSAILITLLLGSKGGVRRPKGARAVVVAFAGYIAASQGLAFFVLRADRRFQGWFTERHAGVAVGMDYIHMRLALREMSTPYDPSYSMDGFWRDAWPEDFILVPKGLARLNVARTLSEPVTFGESPYLLRVWTDRNGEVVSVESMTASIDTERPRY